MVLRSFFAQDSESLLVLSSGNPAIEGGPIVNNSDTPDGTIFEYSAGTGTTITLDDTFEVDVFNDDEPGDHIITDGGGIVANGQGVESESLINVRALDADGNPTGPEITIYVFSQGGVFSDVWGYGTSAPLVDGTQYIKVSGSNAGSSAYTDYIPCFAAGTLIETEGGNCLVEDIHVGQRVWTRDGGLQSVLWVGHTQVKGAGAFAPVVIAPGVIGNSTQLVLSQQHRVLINDAAAEILFGEREVLVAAKHLCGLPGVGIHETEAVRYTHFMFDRHHLVRSNGALSESFFLARNSVGALTMRQRAEILSLFPELGAAGAQFGPTVAPTLGARDAAVLRSYI